MAISAVPGASPVIGHLVPLMRNPVAFMSGLAQHGDLVTIKFGLKTAYVPCTPELIRDMLFDLDTFEKTGPLFEQLSRLFGHGLALCPNDDHRRQRRLIQPAFHKHNLPAYFSSAVEATTEVIASWRDNGVLNVFAETRALAAEVLAATIFVGTTVARQALHAFNKQLADILDQILWQMLLPRPFGRLPLPGNRRFQQARKNFKTILDEAVDAYLAEPSSETTSLLYHLTQPLTTGEKLTKEELVDQLGTFFLAGTETTATTLSWTLHLLSQNPQYKEALYAEVDDRLAGRRPAYDDLAQLPVTTAVITETLRLYPVTAFLTRVARKPVSLGKHNIPAGATVIFSPCIVQHRAAFFPEPEKFDPYRWVSPAPLPKGALIPFGAGPRKCIGDSFAMNNAVLFLATIATHWEFEDSSTKCVRPGFNVSPYPQHFRIRLHARDPRRRRT
ncbi:cytochrome P450 [Actinocrispum sp. NPDC049592]|uniref:cytochrome P450 n=1 Tax=Actinocrispum sp. NPDC049592 TaxID=3154835 RepID=UPI003433E0AB